MEKGWVYLGPSILIAKVDKQEWCCSINASPLCSLYKCQSDERRQECRCPSCLSRKDGAARRLHRDSTVAPPDPPPLVDELEMKLGCLEDTDEHENVASPSADDLDHPALPDRRKDRVLTSRAIADVPENIPTRGGASPCFPVAPRRIGISSNFAARDLKVSG